MWKFHIYKDTGEQYRWRLRSSNGEIVASSGEYFSSKGAARTAAENVRDNAESASVEDDE